MDNKGKRNNCTSMEKTNSRQFIIVITIIVPISVVHFPNELNQNSSQYPNWSCNYKLPELSHTLNQLLTFCPTKPTTFSRLCKNLSYVQTSEFFQISPRSASAIISLCYFNLYSANTLLS